MLFVTIIVASAALLIATVTDIKTREVPDLVSYGLIAAGLGINAISSAVFWTWIPLLESLVGLALGYGIGALMFYTGQWGGGDSKIIMGLGSALGLSAWNTANLDLLMLLLNIIIVGAVYGIMASIVLAARHPRQFIEGLKKHALAKPFVTYRRIILIGALAGIACAFIVPAQFQLWIISATAGIYVLFYLMLFVKVVEKEILIRAVNPAVLTEGDWIAQDVVVRKKIIAGPKDLGVSNEQIAMLIKLKKQKKITSVMLKEGIPFVPSFLIAFILLLALGNWLLVLV